MKQALLLVQKAVLIGQVRASYSLYKLLATVCPTMIKAGLKLTTHWCIILIPCNPGRQPRIWNRKWGTHAVFLRSWGGSWGCQNNGTDGGVSPSSARTMSCVCRAQSALCPPLLMEPIGCVQHSTSACVYVWLITVFKTVGLSWRRPPPSPPGGTERERDPR